MRELTKEPIKILLVDDHVIVRAGLRMLIENHQGMAVVGEAGSRRDALSIAAREQPEIILLDLDMGRERGLDFLSELRATARRAGAVMRTGVSKTAGAWQAVLLGAM